MIYIDIHRQRLSKNCAKICRFVFLPLRKLSWTYGSRYFRNKYLNCIKLPHYIIRLSWIQKIMFDYWLFWWEFNSMTIRGNSVNREISLETFYEVIPWFFTKLPCFEVILTHIISMLMQIPLTKYPENSKRLYVVCESLLSFNY